MEHVHDYLIIGAGMAGMGTTISAMMSFGEHLVVAHRRRAAAECRPRIAASP